MDERIIELRKLIGRWSNLICTTIGSSKNSIIKTYVENIGHTFKKVELNQGPYKFVLKEISESEVEFTNPAGSMIINEDNALGVWNLLETFKNDLTL